MLPIVFVFIGGGIGSVFRYLISSPINKLISNGLPIGTILVNIIGSLIIGFSFALISQKIIQGQEMKMLIVTGFLGGFTTFSTFNYETLTLLQNEKMGLALANIGISLIIGLFFVYVGNLIGKAV